MVRCLTDLGLRCNEVAKLHLDDIDWRQGTLRVTGAKGRRTDILPLPKRQVVQSPHICGMNGQRRAIAPYSCVTKLPIMFLFKQVLSDAPF